MKNIPIYKIQRFGYISGLFVRPEFRKTGVAKELLKYAEKWFDGKGVKRVELKVNVGNDRATTFWKKSGFINQQILMIKES